MWRLYPLAMANICSFAYETFETQDAHVLWLLSGFYMEHVSRALVCRYILNILYSTRECQMIASITVYISGLEKVHEFPHSRRSRATSLFADGPLSAPAGLAYIPNITNASHATRHFCSYSECIIMISMIIITIQYSLWWERLNIYTYSLWTVSSRCVFRLERRSTKVEYDAPRVSFSKSKGMGKCSTSCMRDAYKPDGVRLASSISIKVKEREIESERSKLVVNSQRAWIIQFEVA